MREIFAWMYTDVWDVLALVPLVPLLFTLLNRFTWQAPRVGRRIFGRVSALVPARNEAQNIEGCVRALLETSVDEVLVLDDASTDNTGEIVERLCIEDARVRLIRGTGPGPGWLGKPAACDRLGRAALGDWLLFVDADVRVALDVLEQLSVAEGLDALTAIPRQVVQGWAEKLVIPLMYGTMEGWLWLPLVSRLKSEKFMLAIGQFYLVRRPVFYAIGGFERVRSEVVEDLALGRLIKKSGYRLGFLDGTELASCRMYQDTWGVIDGFSKNLYAGMGNRLWSFTWVCLLYLLCFVVPYVIWPWRPIFGIAVVASLLQFTVLGARHRLPWVSRLGVPLSGLLFVGIAVRSAWWALTRTGHWRGRAILHGKSPILQRVAEKYVSWRVARGLEGLWVGNLERFQTALSRGPVLVLANHVGWWDGLLALLVSVRAGADFRVVAMASTLNKLPWLKYLGVIPLEPGVMARKGLREAARFLDQPGRVVWFFPQGRHRPASVRPLKFVGGYKILVAGSSSSMTVLPAAINYLYRDQHVPAAVLSFGPSLGSGSDPEASVVTLLDAQDRWAEGESAGIVPLVGGISVAPSEGIGAKLLNLGRAGGWN